MGRQWNTIIESLGPLSGGTGLSINANLTDIEALLATLQADVADGIIVTSGTVDSNFTSNIVNADDDSLTSNQSIKVGWMDNANDIFKKTSDTSPFPVNTVGTVSITNGTITLSKSITGGTGPTSFTSTSYGTIATASTGRLGCTIFNEGAGNLHVLLGTATASTSSYTVRLSSGDYYEVPFNYTGLIGGIFATAGTARVTEIS